MQTLRFFSSSVQTRIRQSVLRDTLEWGARESLAVWVGREDVTTLTCRWEFQGEVTKGRSAECLFCSFQVFLVAAYSKPAEIPQTPAVSNRLFYFSLFKKRRIFPPLCEMLFWQNVWNIRSSTNFNHTTYWKREPGGPVNRLRHHNRWSYLSLFLAIPMLTA